MNTILVHPHSEEQEQAVKIVLQAMHIDYEPEMNADQYLRSSPETMARIHEAIEQDKRGEGTLINLDDEEFWK